MIPQNQIKELLEYYSQFDLEDPPTTIWNDGTKEWRKSIGEFRRTDDRPDWIDYNNHTICWRLCDGKWHRELGPACIWNEGNCEYWMDDKLISPRDWFKRIMEI